MAQSLKETTETMASLGGDRLAAVNKSISDATSRLSELLRGFDPMFVAGLGRERVLPWGRSGQPFEAGVERGFVRIELLAIVALATHSEYPHSSPRGGLDVDACIEVVDELLKLGRVRAYVEVDEDDPLSEIRASLQVSELMMRSSSYQEMLEITVRSLFNPPSIDEALRHRLGFGVEEAQVTIAHLHDLQVRRSNQRWQSLADDESAYQRDMRLQGGKASPRRARRPPTSAGFAISPSELARVHKLDPSTVDRIFQAFAWVPADGASCEREVSAFLSGANQLRSRPIIRSASGRALVVHPASMQSAIRERLEEALLGGPAWEQYQLHRARLLEQRTRASIESIIGPSSGMHAFKYFTPEVARMEESPGDYTKRVEADHLFVIDDVAIVVEDKAVALSSGSKAGRSPRLKKDLTGIITKASEQADRLAGRIAQDGGIRTEDGSWVDLSKVVEVHTVAVSLDDLSSTATATADLIRAGVIRTESVPWTVSIHDLDLIAELISEPAEFLLYLRRRRDPTATEIFAASDELDLFLFFRDSGLRVHTADAGREASGAVPKQEPGIITSHTDVLDRWFLGDFLRERRGLARLPTAPEKPVRESGPIDSLMIDINETGAFARTSICATLLSLDENAQHRVSQYTSMVFTGSNFGTRACSIAHDVRDACGRGGWLFVWTVRSVGVADDHWEKKMRHHLRKLAAARELSRAAVFAIDGETGNLLSVMYEAVPAGFSSPDNQSAEEFPGLLDTARPRRDRESTAGQRFQPKRRRRQKK